MEHQKQDCPLCGTTAKYEFFHEPYTKHIECPVCAEFCIDEQAENFFRNTTEEFKKSASDEAKKSNSEYLYILRAPSDSEIKKDPKMVVKPEFIKRDS